MANGTAASRAKARGAAGRSAARTVNFHGLKLEAPKKLDGSLVFKLARLDAAGEDGPWEEIIDLLRTLLGDEQLAKLEAKIESSDLDFVKAAKELFALAGKLVDAGGSSTGK